MEQDSRNTELLTTSMIQKRDSSSYSSVSQPWPILKCMDFDSQNSPFNMLKMAEKNWHCLIEGDRVHKLYEIIDRQILWLTGS